MGPWSTRRFVSPGSVVTSRSEVAAERFSDRFDREVRRRRLAESSQHLHGVNDVGGAPKLPGRWSWLPAKPCRSGFRGALPVRQPSGAAFHIAQENEGQGRANGREQFRTRRRSAVDDPAVFSQVYPEVRRAPISADGLPLARCLRSSVSENGVRGPRHRAGATRPSAGGIVVEDRVAAYRPLRAVTHGCAPLSISWSQDSERESDRSARSTYARPWDLLPVTCTRAVRRI
jgi:hypothetical protein